MSDLEPKTQGPRPEVALPLIDVAQLANIGNVVLGKEAMPSPEDTITRIDAILARPDEQGRMLPKITLNKAGLEKNNDGQLAYLDIGYVDATDMLAGRAELVWDYKAASEHIRHVRIPGGRGYGRTFYLEMARDALWRGHDFRSSNRLRKSGRESWQRLFELGVALKATEEDLETGRPREYYVVNGNNRPNTLLGASDVRS